MTSAKDSASLLVDQLSRRIRDHTARIGVIGLGYVGLPVVMAAADRGFRVLGFDIDRAKIDILNAGGSYIKHIRAEDIAVFRESDRFNPTDDFSRLAQADVVILCVPTPLSPQREPDLSFVVRTTESVASHLRSGQLIVLESTTYPGTTRQVMRPILERSGLRSGTDFLLAYSPEREDPGNSQFGTHDIPKVVGGDGPDALHLASMLYDEIVTRTVKVSSAEVAEAVKLTENIFRSVNIALVNELKVVFEAMGIDVWEVIEAAKTKPFGYMPFYPGPGLGGHCIPIDPFYLTWKAREFNIATRFIELAGEINTAMPQRVVDKAIETLNERAGKALKGARILIVGIAYKKNVDDTRESPAFKIMELLEKRGAQLSFYDPFVAEIPQLREHPEFAGQRGIDWTKRVLAEFELAIICTDHDAVDYKLLVQSCPLVIDTRNVCWRRGIAVTGVVKA
jgi:UDP-N-acetyl-D-glucosamine dehydrogenase